PRRRAWEWKKPLEVEAGLGPLVAAGTVHIGKWDDATLTNAQRATDGREFVPMTRATISSTQHPGWAVKQPVLFLRARAITHLGLVQGASDRVNGALDGDAHDLNGTRLSRA